jgi:puromycin-sensitive aminopeptidase
MAKPPMAKARAKKRPRARGQRAAAAGGGPDARSGAELRLRTDVRPQRYALALELDPQSTRSYRGSLRIELQVKRECEAFELHALDLSVRGVRLSVDGKPLPVRIEPRPELERIRIVPAAPLARGPAVLELRFNGKLRGDLRGLYLASSGERRYAFSQLEAADARRFFPCFDEPSFKARFSIEVVTRARYAVVSNAPQVSSQRLPNGMQRVRFAQTPLLSTYLIALAVGELRASAPVYAGKTPIRVWHVPGQARMTSFALDAARECLLRLERWFGVRYPYAKLDLVAVPDFEIGAMENAGAVFFRETLLLIDEKRASLAEKKRAIEVICHELAHMWYGNLVTMAWWDDLWLNEAFATWMAFAIVDEWQPKLQMWNDFGHGRSSAFGLDALDSTHPIYAPVRTPEEATENFDAITYEKGAAVIRMLERYLGAARFRRGVRAYMRKHRESNARARDLWNALAAHAGSTSGDKGAKADGRDAIDGVVRPWIERAGFPLLHAKLSTRGKQPTLLLEQTRFRAAGETASRGSGRGRRERRERPWPIPVVLALGVRGQRRDQRVLLRTESARVRLPRGTEFVYANAEEGGFYRPLHDAAALAALTKHRKQLASSERLGLCTHLWSCVHAGYGPLDSFLDFACALGDERDPDVLAALAAPLQHVLDQLAPQAGRDAVTALRAVLAQTFAPALDKLGLRARRSEPEAARLRRSELLNLVAVLAEHPPAVQEAEVLCESYLRKSGSVEANLVSPALIVGARLGNARRHARYVAGASSERTPQERRRLRMALGDFSERDCNTRTLALCLRGDTIPTQDVALLLARMLQNPAAAEQTWRFIRDQWPRLQKRVPPLLVGRLIEATPALQTEANRRALLAFAKKYPLPTATRAVIQANERFELDAALRQRAAPQLKTWLATR